jgi:flagellar biosynthesis protein FliR
LLLTLDSLRITTGCDPHNAQQISLATNFQDILAMLICLPGSTHHCCIRALAENLRIVPCAGVLSLLGKVCVVATQHD